MNCYPMAAVERMMKIQEVILRAMAKKITWWQAAEIIGITDRQMRRWHWRYREYGYYGLLDHRVGKPRPQRVPLAVVEQVFALYREKYFDFNVRHFHEKLEQEHEIRLSYTWVKKALQGVGLVRPERKRRVVRPAPPGPEAARSKGVSPTSGDRRGSHKTHSRSHASASGPPGGNAGKSPGSTPTSPFAPLAILLRTPPSSVIF